MVKHMLSNRQIRNFKHYLNTTPRADWGKSPPIVGAYDAVGGARAHGFRSRRLDMRHFDFGGAFDAIGETDSDNVTKALKFLASKLSKADWAEFQQALCGERDDDGAEDREPPDLMKMMTDPDPDDFGGPAMDSANDGRARAGSFAKLFPDASPVHHV